jgi:hypothetical protein
MSMRFLSSGIVFLLALQLTACGGDSADQKNTPALKPDSSVAAAALAVEKPKPVGADNASKTNPLVQYKDGLVSVSAVDVSQRVLLVQLSKKVGFGLQLNYQQWSSVSLTMTEVPVDEVLKAILGPIPHKIFFRADVPGPARVVQGLLVGEPQDTSQLASRTANSMADRLQKMNLPRPEQVEQQEPISKDQVMAMSDEEKVKFLAFVEPSEANMPVLLDMLKSYPDADVRIAVMASIENADTPQAAQAIVELFNDADPKIVLAAIDSIEFAGSEANIQSLQPLLQHPNPAVQSAAREAIDFLR